LEGGGRSLPELVFWVAFLVESSLSHSGACSTRHRGMAIL